MPESNVGNKGRTLAARIKSYACDFLIPSGIRSFMYLSNDVNPASLYSWSFLIRSRITPCRFAYHPLRPPVPPPNALSRFRRSDVALGRPVAGGLSVSGRFLGGSANLRTLNRLTSRTTRRYA
ncbi:hypothetical protein Mal65_29280 [Crateriforma conspicua]|nr:hypothetical protein Mal65_29280 [Crateriforma conspicua]